MAVGGLPDVEGARAEAMVSSTAGSGAMVLLMIAPGPILVPKTLGLLKASSLAVVDVRGASSSLLRSHKIYGAESLAALVLSVSCLRTCSAPV